MNLPKMKWFKCECGHNFEECVEKEDTVCKCETCGKLAKVDIEKEVLHRPGGHYNHVTWSLWQAGN